MRSTSLEVTREHFDITKLMEQHQDSGDHDAGAALGRPEAEDAQNALTASMQPEAEEADE